MGVSLFRMAPAWTQPLLLSNFLGHEGYQCLSKAKRLELLFFAVLHGNPAPLKRCIASLLESTSGATGPSSQEDKVISMHKVAKACQLEAIEVLISYQFNIDSLNPKSAISLHSACQARRCERDLSHSQHIATCQVLLANGADIRARDENGNTAISIAEDHFDYQLLTLLLEHVVSFEGQHLLAPTLFSALDIEEDKRLSGKAKNALGGQSPRLSVIRQPAAVTDWRLFDDFYRRLFRAFKLFAGYFLG